MRIKLGFVTTLAVLALASAAGADEINLSTGDSGTSNGAIYSWIDQQTTGTGVIEPFLRVQGDEGKTGIEQGYNTSYGTPWQTKAGLWTHELQVADLVTKEIDGVYYYEFLLDINQNRGGDNELITLDQVQIYTGPLITTPEANLNLGTLRFNSDTGTDGDTTVLLDFIRNPGSGAGDMFLYVPTSLFAGASNSDYVYFYTKFGGDPWGASDTLYGANDGFEEWALVGQPTTVPDGGATALLLGLGMLGLGVVRRFRR